MNILDEDWRKLGEFESTTPSGEKWKTTIYDMKNWATGHVMVRQEGEGQIHDQVHNVEDCKRLGLHLLAFAYPNAPFAQYMSQLGLDAQ